MKKKLLAILITLCMIIALFPQVAMVSKAEDTPLYVGGIEILDGVWYKNADISMETNADGSISSGTAEDYNVYYSEGNLYLNGFVYDGLGYQYVDREFIDSAIIYSEGSINIVLENENSIRCQSSEVDANNAIYSPLSDITVTGDGSLTIDASAYGIYADEMNLTIRGVTLHIKTDNAVALNARETVSITDGATVVADAGTYAINSNYTVIDGAKKIDVTGRCAVDGKAGIVIHNCDDITARSVNSYAEGEQALQCRIENGISITMDSECIAMVSTDYDGGGAQVYDISTGNMEVQYKYFRLRKAPTEDQIEVLPKRKQLKLGAFYQLGYNMYENGTLAAQPEVTWKSSNTSVATVDENGLVNAVEPGKVDITVSYDSGNAVCTDICQITIPDDYCLTVGGVSVNSKNKDNLTAAINAAYGAGSASGTIKYIPATKDNAPILVMENATLRGPELPDILGEKASVAIGAESSLTIQLKGRNVIACDTAEEFSSAILLMGYENEIRGGQLYVIGGDVTGEEGDSSALEAFNLRITDSNVTFEGGKTNAALGGSSTGLNIIFELTVENSLITAEGKDGALFCYEDPIFNYDNGYQWKNSVDGPFIDGADTAYTSDYENPDTYLHIRPAGTVIVTYVANDGSNAIIENDGISLAKEYALSTNAFTRAGYVLKGWNTRADGKGTFYAAGTKIKLSGDVTLYAQWEKTKPKVTVSKTAIKKLVAKKKALTIKWKKKSGVTGYEVQVALKKNFKKGLKTKSVKGAKKTFVTIKKLKAKKKYFVRVRVYKTVSGEKYTSAWCTVKTKKTK